MSRQLGAVILLAMGLLLTGCADDIHENGYQSYAAEQDYFANRSFASRDAIVTPTTQPVEIALGEDAQLRDYLTYAALHSPELEAAFSAWKAALERAPQAKALPDPRFSYKYYVVEQMMRDGDMRHMFEVSQELPWPGKLRLRENIANEEANAEFHRFEAAKLKVFYRVQKSYGEYYYLWRATQITEQNIDLLNQIESIARTRYSVGTDNHPDVIRSQLEQGKLADRLRTLQKLRTPVMAQLNAALNRPTTAELPWPKEIPLPESDFSDEQLLSWAAQTNPEVQAMDREIAARESGVSLAKKDYYPDIMVGVEYGVMVDTAGMSGENPENPYALMIGLNIPIWWEKYAAGVREARWRRLKAVSDKAAMLNNLSADVEMALFEFQDSGRKINLYRDTLIPKAEQALQVTQAAYRSGRADFQDYLDAQRVLLEFQLSYERSQADRAQRMAELEMLVGKALPVTVTP